MLFIVPAVFCLLIKLYLVRASLKNPHTKQNLFLLLLVFFVFNNVAELLMRGVFFAGYSPKFWFKIYYVSIISSLTVLLIYSINVSRVLNHIKAVKYLLVITCISLSCVILYTDQMVEGFTIISQLPNAIRGSSFWLFRLASNLLMLSTLAVLSLGYKQSNNHQQQNRCLYLLIAVLPLMITGLVLMFLISRGYANSGLLLIPVAGTFFSYVLLKTESRHQLIDLRKHIPFSKERIASESIQTILSRYSMEDLSHKEAMNDIERVLVNYKNQKTNNNISHAAKSMNIPRSTLYAILKRLDMHTK